VPERTGEEAVRGGGDGRDVQDGQRADVHGGGGLLNDADGRAAAERARRVAERLRAAASRVADSLRGVANDVRAHIGGERGLAAARGALERAGDAFERGVKSLTDRVRGREVERDRGRGGMER